MVGGRVPERIGSAGAVLFAALLMTWPMVYNGFPVLYPDSVYYLQAGERIARALFLGQFSDHYGQRSLFYALGILPFHWNVTAWPIVWLNATLTAYMLWLVTRSLLPRRTILAYLALVVPLSVLTGLGWFVSLIMPDVLGPALYLGIFLMAFCWESLSRAERILVGLIAWWAMASHSTHLLLAGGLCILVALVLVLQRQPRRQWLGAASRVGAIVLLVVSAQVAIHFYLQGEPSITGARRLPYLLARVIVDGPGRWYLEQHCGELELAICDHLDELPDNAHDFLFAPGGVYGPAPPALRERLRREEMQVVLGTLRAHPWAELRISAGHGWRQLQSFGLWGYNPRQQVLDMLEIVLPEARARYLESRQVRDELRGGFFTRVQHLTVRASVLLIGVCALLLGRSWPPRLVGFTAVIVSVVIANAAVTGALATVEDRFQGRVIWLVPLLAGVLALCWLDRRAGAGGRAQRTRATAVPSSRG